MDIIKSDFKKGKVKLRINDADDLWYLSHLIEPGDFVKGRTTRKVKIGESENAKVAKKTYILMIEAETVEFADNVRINGKVKEGPEEIPKDSYHSISLEENNEFTLQKVSWPEYQKQKLSEATKKRYNYLICLFDREEALFALTKQFGYEILAKTQGEVPKKTKTVEVKKDFQQEIIKALDVYSGRYDPENIIIASPAFYKEDLFKKISAGWKEKVVLSTCSEISENSIGEVLKKPELGNTLKSSKARTEQLIVDNLLKEIKTKGKAAYGWEEVKKLSTAGAVQDLLVTHAFIHKSKEDGSYHNVDSIMKKVDVLQGKIHLLSSEFDSGKKIDGLGGVAAILRYSVNE